MLSVLTNHVVSFIATYTVLDAVLPDLDSLEVVPDNLRWAVERKPRALEEYFHLLLESDWKKLEKVDNLNLTVDWAYSKIFQRDLLKFTTFFKLPVSDVADSMWLEHVTLDGWGAKSMFLRSRMIGYSGRNVSVLALDTMPVGSKLFIAPRDSVTMLGLLSGADSIREGMSQNHISPEVENLLSHDPDNSKVVLFIMSNVSGTVFDLKPKEGVVRADTGTAGVLMTDETPSPASPPLTKVQWMVNSDGKSPSFMPRTVTRRIFSSTIKTGIADWRNFLANRHPESVTSEPMYD